MLLLHTIQCLRFLAACKYESHKLGQHYYFWVRSVSPGVEMAPSFTILIPEALEPFNMPSINQSFQSSLETTVCQLLMVPEAHFVVLSHCNKAIQAQCLISVLPLDVCIYREIIFGSFTLNTLITSSMRSTS